jgi:hypothetical protein
MCIISRLREEVDRVLGERTQVTYADLGDLKYCACVFKETLRLWPPAPVFSRVTTKPMRIGDYDVPGNTWVLVKSKEFYPSIKISSIFFYEFESSQHTQMPEMKSFSTIRTNSDRSDS